jgi:hypothetical protein
MRDPVLQYVRSAEHQHSAVMASMVVVSSMMKGEKIADVESWTLHLPTGAVAHPVLGHCGGVVVGTHFKGMSPNLSTKRW